jgi:hypothetical protein
LGERIKCGVATARAVRNRCAKLIGMVRRLFPFGEHKR